MTGGRTQRRVVTGHDGDGGSVIVSDEALPMRPGTTEDGRFLAEIWATGTPAAAAEPAASTIRIVDLPPGGRRDPHATRTVDYVILLEGALWLVLDRTETELSAGDVVVQRGTRHGWHNRSDAVARVAFVNLTGQADPADVQVGVS